MKRTGAWYAVYESKSYRLSTSAKIWVKAAGSLSAIDKR